MGVHVGVYSAHSRILRSSDNGRLMKVLTAMRRVRRVGCVGEAGWWVGSGCASVGGATSDSVYSGVVVTRRVVRVGMYCRNVRLMGVCRQWNLVKSFVSGWRMSLERGTSIVIRDLVVCCTTGQGLSIGIVNGDTRIICSDVVIARGAVTCIRVDGLGDGFGCNWVMLGGVVGVVSTICRVHS